MNHYAKLVSKIQSRMAKRASTITSTEHWKLLYKAQRNFGDMAEAKKLLRELEASQKLDKQILKEFEQAAYQERAYGEFMESTYGLEVV